MNIVKSIIVLLSLFTILSGQIIVGHNSTNLPLVPANWIDSAKVKLHIAYGHTSHGSQVTTGMNGLVGFTGGYGMIIP